MQEEITDEELLASDLMSIIHVFSTRHYSKRSSERRRKTISETTTRRCKELLDAGLSIGATVERLNREKHRAEDGGPITKRIVRRVYLSRAKLEKVMPKVGRTSGADYLELFIVPADENSRLPISAVYDHYAKWANSLDKVVIEKRHFSALLAKQYRKSIYEGLMSYHGIMVKGQQFHVVTRRASPSLGFNTPLDVLKAFLVKFNQTKTTSNELWAAYNSFCKEHEIDPMKRETLGRVMLQIGVKKFMGTKGWSYNLEGAL